jgi:CheY-like chemotaxis protein
METKIKILMVDDEEQFRATTRKILNRRGFDTLLAANGPEALEKIKEKPHVVILDVKMPGMDGHEVLRAMKKIAPDIPVIMLTGHGALPSAQEALTHGAFDYLAKPCDIDILANKVLEAVRHEKKPRALQENRVMDVMIPIEDYTTLKSHQTVREAVERLKESFQSKVSTSRLMETGHRSVLVLDDRGKVQGILAIADLLDAIMPAYLSAPRPSMADSIQYSPMFWTGMFTREIHLLGNREIREIMTPDPPTIDAGANLMEAAFLMYSNKARRLVVMRSGDAVGVVREQDLFFEMERTLTAR